MRLQRRAAERVLADVKEAVAEQREKEDGRDEANEHRVAARVPRQPHLELQVRVVAQLRRHLELDQEVARRGVQAVHAARHARVEREAHGQRVDHLVTVLRRQALRVSVGHRHIGGSAVAVVRCTRVGWGCREHGATCRRRGDVLVACRVREVAIDAAFVEGEARAALRHAVARRAAPAVARRGAGDGPLVVDDRQCDVRLHARRDPEEHLGPGARLGPGLVQRRRRPLPARKPHGQLREAADNDVRDAVVALSEAEVHDRRVAGGAGGGEGLRRDDEPPTPGARRRRDVVSGRGRHHGGDPKCQQYPRHEARCELFANSSRRRQCRVNATRADTRDGTAPENRVVTEKDARVH
mmetsp:Transcript_25944/g.80170  ORF Transcript_25944/g.80170 Transcript_25944/m.80170 type:complete len:354 (+) Transcript_25944:1019-2080(+)